MYNIQKPCPSYKKLYIIEPRLKPIALGLNSNVILILETVSYKSNLRQQYLDLIDDLF